MPGSREKPLEWLGSSKKDLMALPIDVRRFFGHALHFAQQGEKHDAAKPLKGFGGAGVLEVVENDEGDTYRAVYTVRYEEAVFVLHCFQKKSKSGPRDRHAQGRQGGRRTEVESSSGKDPGDSRWQSEWLKG